MKMGKLMAVGVLISALSGMAAGTDDLPWVYTPEAHPADVTVRDDGSFAAAFSTTWSCVREKALEVFRSTCKGIVLLLK